MDRHTEDRSAHAPNTPVDDASEALTMGTDAGGTLPAPAGPRAGLLAPGQRFGPYEIHRLLGRGGMGEVYEAEETASGRRVALKLFNRPIGSPIERDRFLREGQLAASISHPNSVYIFGTDEIQGMPVIAMELASAGTLKDTVGKRGPLPPAEAVDAILQVVDGLEAAAAVGVLHRDIKPANCFVDRDGTVKVGDFGLSISTLARDETHLTVAGTILGTPAFASPEQMRGDALDIRGDIYSVGATLYYLLTGRAPFEEANLVKLVGQVLTDSPSSPRAVKADVPKGLAAVVLRCLKKSPADRPQTYASLRQALVPFASMAPTPATLGLRFLAALADMVVMMAVSVPSTAAMIRQARAVNASGAGAPPGSGLWETAAGVAVALAYYTLLEGLWGRSLGKALLGLRVVDLRRRVPGIRRALIRAIAFVVAQNGLGTALILALGGPAAYLAAAMNPSAAPWLGLLPITLTAIGVSILFGTSRRSNGFAGLHDMWSGTRVVSRAAVAAAQTAREADQARPASPTARALGPYQVVDDAVGPAAGVLVAYDPRLRRNVWIQPRPAGADALAVVRRELGRKGRLRWLTGLRTPADCWDAFEAVEGRSLPAAVERPQPWVVVRAWLRDIAEEVDAASKDGTLPVLTADAVWIGADGRVRLLDWSGARGADDPGTAQDFLAVVARSALAGRMAESPEEGSGLKTGPIPLSARRLLDDLSAHWFASKREVAETLGGLMTKRPDISRGLRGGHLALALLLPLMVLPTVVVRLSSDWQLAEVNAWLHVLRRADRAGGDGLSAEAREAVGVYAASLLPSDTSRFEPVYQPVIERLRRAHPRVTPEQRHEAEAKLATLGVKRDTIVAEEKLTIAFVAVLVPPVLWSLLALVSLLCATVARGGLFLSLFGISVVREDGARASRRRCFVRALVAWLPVLTFQAGAMAFFLVSGRPGFDPSRAGNRAMTAGAVLVGVALAAVFLAGAIRAALRPERGWQDQIAGTWLVPK